MCANWHVQRTHTQTTRSECQTCARDLRNLSYRPIYYTFNVQHKKQIKLTNSSAISDRKKSEFNGIAWLQSSTIHLHGLFRDKCEYAQKSRLLLRLLFIRAWFVVYFDGVAQHPVLVLLLWVDRRRNNDSVGRQRRDNGLLGLSAKWAWCVFHPNGLIRYRTADIMDADWSDPSATVPVYR